MLENADVLQTIAEIGATFAGFSALVTALGKRDDGEDRRDQARFHVAVTGALMIVMGGLVPFVAQGYFGDGEPVWRVSAAFLFALNWAYIAYSVIGSRKQAEAAFASPDSGPWFYVLEVAFQVPLVLAIFAIGPVATLYLTAVVALVAQGAVVFVRLFGSVMRRGA